VLLLVNPVSGKGKGKAIVREQVLPLLEAAGCIVDLKGEVNLSTTALIQLIGRNAT
jgi:diacylglycerol kinase family enzyme